VFDAGAPELAAFEVIRLALFARRPIGPNTGSGRSL
jgi:hypothetical protein